MTLADIAALRSAVVQAASEAREVAERDAFREQTDFQGRIADCVWNLDGLYDDATETYPGDDREAAIEILISLAGSCIGLVAMLRTPEPANGLTGTHP